MNTILNNQNIIINRLWIYFVSYELWNTNKIFLQIEWLVNNYSIYTPQNLLALQFYIFLVFKICII